MCELGTKQNRTSAANQCVDYTSSNLTVNDFQNAHKLQRQEQSMTFGGEVSIGRQKKYPGIKIHLSCDGV